jgi:hypothetical protein
MGMGMEAARDHATGFERVGREVGFASPATFRERIAG